MKPVQADRNLRSGEWEGPLSLAAEGFFFRVGQGLSKTEIQSSLMASEKQEEQIERSGL